jgi:ligand-binding sensor domain-containing protein/signal transduction histidine kinase
MADGTDVRFAHVSFGEGPSSSSIKGIIQDSQGFLWFGTQDGLKRYDGYRFRDYRKQDGNPNGLSGTAISALFLDRSGTLWVASDWFLDRYDPATERFVPARTGSGGPMRFGAGINNINQDSNGTIWLSTTTGLFRLDPGTGSLSHYDHQPGDPASLSSDLVKSTFEEKDGTFWVATTEGLDVFDRRTARVTDRIPLNPPTAKTAMGTAIPRLRGDQPIKLMVDHAGVLWAIFPFGGGLATVDRKAHKLIAYAFNGAGVDSFIDGIQEDREGSLWLASSADGLLKLDRTRRLVVRYRNNPLDPGSLSSDNVQALFEDREGNIWVGTQGGDLNRFTSRPPPFKRYRHEPGNPNSLLKDEVTSVYEDSRGILWVGNRVALNRIDRKTGQYTIYRTAGGPGELSNTYVISIVEDHSGYLWFGTSGGGLNRFDGRTGQFKVYRHDPADPGSLSDDLVYSLFVDREGAFWVGTDNGLDRFDPATERFQAYKAAEPNMSSYRAIGEDRAGRLWLATVLSGLHRFDPATGRFTVYQHSSAPGSLSNDWVNTVCIDRLGIVWAGTQSGLNRLDPATDKFLVYDERNGLPNSNLSGILEDARGNLWIGTNKGLSRFDPVSGRFTNYYLSDGLPSNEFYRRNGVFKSKTGEMFFSSTGGLAAFFPDRVIENSDPPPVVLTDFLLADDSVRIADSSPLHQSISLTRSLTLEPKQNIFSFEFSALSFANPSRNRYRYRLEPLETVWKERDSSHRTVTYTTLPPGDYTFRVQGSNNRGTWNDTGASVHIRILPPWWATWTFRAACFLSVVAAILSLHFYRLREIARQLNLRFEERLAERTRIAQELHDTLLQGFLSASMQLHVTNDNLPENSPAKASLSRILELMSRVIEEGRNAVRGLRLLHGDSGLEQLFSRIAQENPPKDEITYHVVAEGPSRSLHPLVRDEVYRIGREAVINAFQHSHGSRVELTVEYASRCLRVLVRDDGCGIDPALLRSGRDGHWGLAGMRERAERIGAQLHVWSDAARGTEVEVTVPAHSAFQDVAVRSQFLTMLAFGRRMLNRRGD